MNAASCDPRHLALPSVRWLSAALLALPCAVSAAPEMDLTPTSLDDRVSLRGELPGRSLQERSALAPTSRLSVTQIQSEPLATQSGSNAAATWNGRSADARQTMLWARPWSQKGLRVGLGVEQRGRAIGGGFQQNPYQNLRPGAAGDAGVLVGLAMPTGPRSHVFVQTPLVEAERPAYEELGLAAREGRQVRVGLSFNTRKPYADLRKGFKMQLSGQSSVTLRPRGGGRLSVTFQKVF